LNDVTCRTTPENFFPETVLSSAARDVLRFDPCIVLLSTASLLLPPLAFLTIAANERLMRAYNFEVHFTKPSLPPTHALAPPASTTSTISIATIREKHRLFVVYAPSENKKLAPVVLLPLDHSRARPSMPPCRHQGFLVFATSSPQLFQEFVFLSA